MEMIDNPLPTYSNDDDKRTMEMIDNPLPIYRINDEKNTGKSGIRKTRIQSFTEKSGLTEGSSGLTLGLILKEYCEFQVINSILMLYLNITDNIIVTRD